MNISRTILLAPVLLLCLCQPLVGQTGITIDPIETSTGRKNISLYQYLLDRVAIVMSVGAQTRNREEINFSQSSKYSSLALGGRYLLTGRPRRLDVFREMFPYMRKWRKPTPFADSGCYSRSYWLRDLLGGASLGVEFEHQSVQWTQMSDEYDIRIKSSIRGSSLNLDIGYSILIENLVLGVAYRTQLTRYNPSKGTEGVVRKFYLKKNGRQGFHVQRGIKFEIGIQF